MNHAARAYSPVYRAGQTNHCPGCGRSHWFIGRILAECGFCQTAIPLQDASVSSTIVRKPKFEAIS